ncbi:uncharacterized protein LOC111271684 [Varroa jacobsoni]|uniref:uncharacterized protein LOC111271684 n=1 Tax=Varroa jacobsoni TaxID=62625 RepID=UPI000BF683F7|nr:uncharacterized protein LOC111271684 [Varroa jacobsoni]
MAFEAFDKKTHVMMARCRAQCLNQFYVFGSENNCFDDGECWMCWDSCSLVYKRYKAWAPLCNNKHLCFPGCQEACNFRRLHSNYTETTKNMDVHPMPPLKYSYRKADDAIHFDWSVSETKQIRGKPLVYVLLILDQLTSNWQQLTQTFYTNVTMRRGLLKLSSKLQLTAYSPNGQVGQIEQWCSDFDFHSENSRETLRDEGYLEDSARQRHQGDVSLELENHRSQWMPVLQALRHSTKHLGGIDAVLSWSRVSYDADIRYEVQWKRTEQALDITGQLTTYNNVGVVTLWPNSIYQVSVRAFVFGSLRPVAESKTLIVDTATHTSGSRPLIETCSGCISPQYIIGVGLSIATIFIISIFMAVRVMKRVFSQWLSSNTTPKTSTSVSSKSGKKQSLSNRHASVKKQLSALSARISQDSRSSTAKHDRLVEEEDPSTVFEKRSDNDCNI